MTPPLSREGVVHALILAFPGWAWWSPGSRSFETVRASTRYQIRRPDEASGETTWCWEADSLLAHPPQEAASLQEVIAAIRAFQQRALRAGLRAVVGELDDPVSASGGG